MLLPLTQGSYQARSLIASAQRCVNLYPEKNPPDSPVPFTHYLTPGLTQLLTSLDNGVWRCLYEASNGNIYGVVDQNIYALSQINNTWTLGPVIGTLQATLSTPVYIQDNGIVAIVADGSSMGYAIDILNGNAFAQITDPNFLGATKVDYLDTFFIFNKPGTNEWYISLSEANYEMFTGTLGAILTGNISTPGAGYSDGTYVNQPLIGGSGSSATATIQVTNGAVSNLLIISSGTNYVVGDQLTATLVGSGIATWSATVGSSYTDGLYSNVALTGGGGTGALANITVSSGAVSNVDIIAVGINYVVGDALGASLPVGSGFALTILTVAGNGFIATVDTIGGGAFDPLDIATKTGYPDEIINLIVMHLEIWLIGSQTTEIWYNAGAADFTFQILPGVFIEHGCAAPYSVARQDLSIYWLSKDRQGQNIVLRGNNYAAHRISTYAIENEFASYPTISDAIGFTYQQLGHLFYVLTFPTANKTWVWDDSIGLWHERSSFNLVTSSTVATDPTLGRSRANCACASDGTILVGDYNNGILWEWDPNSTYEGSVGIPLPRIRSFPHLVDDQKRVSYKQFIADMEVGTDTTDTSTTSTKPVVALRWSNDRGKTYTNYVEQSLGQQGQYLISPQWRRLGIARDRIFELSWSADAITALNGGWIDSQTAGT